MEKIFKFEFTEGDANWVLRGLSELSVPRAQWMTVEGLINKIQAQAREQMPKSEKPSIVEMSSKEFNEVVQKHGKEKKENKSNTKKSEMDKK